MKTKGIILAIFVALLIACNNQQNSITIEHIIIDNGDMINSTLDIPVLNPEIPVGVNNYLKIVNYIKENGYTIDYEPFYRQYIFFDKFGNKHTARVLPVGDTINNCPPINVYVQQKYDHSFCYNITEVRALPYQIENPCLPKYMEITKSGYAVLQKIVDKEYITIGPLSVSLK